MRFRLPSPLAGLRARLARTDARVWDATVTIAFAALVLLTYRYPSLGGEEGNPALHDLDALWLVFALASVAPLYLRRRHPLPCLVVSLVAIEVLVFAPYDVEPATYALFVLTYAVARHGPDRIAWAGIGLVYAALALVTLSDQVISAANLTVNIIFFTAVWITGREVRQWRARVTAELAEVTETVEAERQRAELAVVEERLRIAQELHDVVAHSISVIAVQAGMGQAAFDVQPEDARQALAAISETSRATMNEMRRLLGVLRDQDDGEVRYSPAPGLTELPSLVETVRKAGVPVEYRVSGERNGVPAGVDLSAYRIVQEALTNVLKHAGPATAHVTIRYDAGAVGVEVVDDGRGAAAHPNAAPAGSGHGLVGMRERVSVYGGTLEAGPVAGGGYRVRSRIPYDAADQLEASGA